MYHEFSPDKNLRRLVSTYMLLDADDTPGSFFAPDITHTSMIITVKSNVEINCNNTKVIPPPFSIKGAFDAPFHFSYRNGEIRSIIIDFHPIGMHEITGQSGTRFTNKFVDAREIWNEGEVAELFNKLSAPISIHEQVSLIDRFLEEKAPNVLSEKSLIVEKADELASRNNYQQSIKVLTHELGVSETSMRRAFKEVLGISPKQYFARALFEEILKRYSVEKQNMIDVLSDSQFYDFSHINKWFKKFTHTSPSEFVNYDIDFIEKVLARKRTHSS